jgi:catechol 2,3-dioxygenase-like lactoylglutathione lyase family enzyme
VPRPKTSIRALGEIALRVKDLDAMQRFYEEVIGLELMRRFPDSAFFRIASGFGGHTQILALFDRSERIARGDRATPATDTSTIDHIAFAIPLDEFTEELERLRALGLQVTTAEHAWVRWRSLYVKDPEGNNVELVCFDEHVGGST